MTVWDFTNEELEANPDLAGPDTEICPEHGKQEVTGYGSTTGPDPYGISDLACGHSVICLGPGDDNIIYRGRRHLP